MRKFAIVDLNRFALPLSLVLSVLIPFDTKAASPVSWGLFVDTFYGVSSASTPGRDRSFVTQAVRQNEFNVNLAHLEARISDSRVRGRLALQLGTSVQANYAAEPAVGSNSGPSMARHLQEAVVGYEVAPGTWVDAGIQFSHLGLESFVSRDNPTYTRSLVAELSPYYQAGVKVSHAIDSRWSVQLLGLNGWQTISENDESKALGTQIQFKPRDGLTIAYNTFFGKVNSLRQFHDLVVQVPLGAGITSSTELDLGHDTYSWLGLTQIVRIRVAERSSLALRLERYADPHGVIVATPGGLPFRVWSGSAGWDHSLSDKVQWRSEFKLSRADEPVYATRSGATDREVLGVTSLSLSY